MTGLGRRSCAVVVTGALVSFAAGASADDEGGSVRLPVSYVERGITNPAAILSPEVDLAIARSPGAANPLAGAASSAQVDVALGLQTGYSITNDFGVRATVASVNLSSPAYFAGAGGGATYRFLRGEFEMGVAVDVNVVLPPPSSGATSGGNAVVEIAPSIPMHVHFGKRARLDVAPGFPILVGTGNDAAGSSSPTLVSFALPLQIAVDIIEPLHVGATTGVTMILNPCAVASGAGCTATVGQTIGIPVGFIAGYAVAGRNGPLLDIDPFFMWTQLFVPGAPSPEPTTYSGNYTIGLAFTGYFYF